MSVPGQRGFTLVELLVVLVVVGLIAALATPRFHRAMPGLRLETTSGELAAALRHSRAEAIRSNRDTALDVDLAARSFRPSDAVRATAIADGIAVEVVSAAGEAPADDVARIRFFPDGTSTGGRITLAGGGRSVSVTVDWLTGRVDLAP